MAKNDPAEDIRTLLNDSLKGTSGTDLFSLQWGSGVNGDEVDKQILVRTDSFTDALIKDEYEQPTVNILVRGTKKESLKSVYDRARDIYEFMIQQERQTLNTTEYVEFAPIGGLISLGPDDNGRHVYSMSFYTYRDVI